MNYAALNIQHFIVWIQSGILQCDHSKGSQNLDRNEFHLFLNFEFSFRRMKICAHQELWALSHFILFLFFAFSGSHLRHMEVPRLGVELELQLPAYTMATATRDPSRVCDLHYSSWQRWVLNLWLGPGIKPTSSWFTSTEPQRELPFKPFYKEV